MKLSTTQLNRVLRALDLGHRRRLLIINNFGIDDLDIDVYNNNVYCVDDKGTIIWQVKAPPSRHGRDAFAFAKIIDDEVVANRGSGEKYSIDKSTGEAKEIGFEK